MNFKLCYHSEASNHNRDRSSTLRYYVTNLVILNVGIKFQLKIKKKNLLLYASSLSSKRTIVLQGCNFSCF